MNKQEKQHIRDIVENEGFDYAFRNYSSFAEIKDAQFHALRLDYVNAAKALSQYIQETKR